MANQLWSQLRGLIRSPISASMQLESDELSWIRSAQNLAQAHDALVDLNALAFPAHLPVSGKCFVCQLDVDFDSLGIELETINWRESLACPSCRLIMRWRSGLHLFDLLAKPRPSDEIYLTEALGPLASKFAERYSNLQTSEFVSDKAAPGSRHLRRGNLVRHEDVTELSFKDQSLQHIVTFDVLEHVPNVTTAIAEFHRCLKSTGTLSITVPFILDQAKSIRRASVDQNGKIIHHHEPQYHGDPLSDDGILCFHEFAWDFLDQLRQVGFAQVSGYLFASTEYGYYGPNITIFARK